MTGTLIVSTPKSSMHALAFQGIAASSCYAQIRDMLMRRFGDEYMLLFARPAENPGNGEIDWYTPVQGPVQKLEGLPVEEREPIERKLSLMGGEILRYAEELVQNGDHQKVTRGSILRLALSYPDQSDLYVVGQQPVITCWGFGPGTPGVEPENLWRVVPAGRPAPPARENHSPDTSSPGISRPVSPTPASGPGWTWLYWLLPLFPLLLLLLLLFGAFGSLQPLAGTRLFAIPGPWGEQGIDPAKIEAMRDELANLDSRLRSHVALCFPGEGNAPVARTPDAPKLVIPENAKDASFLEGRWLCETGLANKHTGEPVKVYLRFDRNGSGEVVTYETNDKCNGHAMASMRGESLHIEVGEQHCEKNGRGYSAMGIDCKNGAGSQTICYGQHTNGSAWDANFVRIN